MPGLDKLSATSHMRPTRAILLQVFLLVLRDYFIAFCIIAGASWLVSYTVFWVPTFRTFVVENLMRSKESTVFPPFGWRFLFGFLFVMASLGIVLTVWGLFRMIVELCEPRVPGRYYIWQECCCCYRDPFCCYYSTSACTDVNCDCARGGGECDPRLCVVILIIFAIIGILIVAIAGVIHTAAIVRRHASKIKRRSSIGEYIVVSRSDPLHVV